MSHYLSRYVPTPVWSDLFLSCGAERWEAFRLATLNEQNAEMCLTDARRARSLADLHPADRCVYIKRAVYQERQARIRSERAQMWRKLAAKIPYPDEA